MARPKPTRQRAKLPKGKGPVDRLAIENVRLSNALAARNAELTEALDQQTATSEILRVISSSPTDVQPVFDIIGERAEKLCEAEMSVVSRVEGEMIQLASIHGVSSEAPGSAGVSPDS